MSTESRLTQLNLRHLENEPEKLMQVMEQRFDELDAKNKELELQKFLRNGGKPEELTEKYAIKVTPHGKYPNLLLFKYNQIDSPMGEKIVQECRGIILDSTDNWKVVCYSYPKFFNKGEGHAATINMATAKVMDKLDGSLCQLFYYDNDWQIASSGTPDASGEVNTLIPGVTFAKLFWDTWKDLKYSLPHDKSRCYALELMTPYNRIICVYKQPRIALHGVRDLNTLQELEPESIAEKYGWECVKSFKMNSLEDVAKMADTLNPMDNEGYVVVDDRFNRQKIKNPQYVALSHIKDGMSMRRMIEIVRTNENSEFLTYFPEFANLYHKTRQKYDELVAEIEQTYAQHKDIPVQKDFALTINKKPYAGVLFALRGNKSPTIKSALQEMNIDKLGELLGFQALIKQQRLDLNEAKNI